MRVLATMENPRHYGAITCLCVDKKHAWLVVGTTTGVLTLWDLRFGMLLKSWRVGISSAETARASRIYQIVLHPTLGKGRWVMVAFETAKPITPGVDVSSPTTLVEVWDIEKTLLMETYATREIVAGGSGIDDELPQPAEITGEPTEVNPATAIAALVRSRQQSKTPLDRLTKRPAQSCSPGDAPLVRPSMDVRAIVVGSDLGSHSSKFELDSSTSGRSSGGRGFMISGSEDRKLRLWDLARVERSTVLSGAETEVEKPGYRWVPFHGVTIP
jgi:phosphoinositide-3-kinase regulatory subunit 4